MISVMFILSIVSSHLLTAEFPARPRDFALLVDTKGPDPCSTKCSFVRDQRRRPRASIVGSREMWEAYRMDYAMIELAANV